MDGMMNKRSFLAALPLFFAAACARAQTGQSPLSADLSNMPPQSLNELAGANSGLAWFKFEGTARLSANNENVRPVVLHRAIATGTDGRSARIFDIWQVGDLAPSAGASVTANDFGSNAEPNDAGHSSIWLDRAFSHPALQKPIELSRMSATLARVMVIDADEIWLVEGGLAAAPNMNPTAVAAFQTWRSS
jgi:hypothetical protein